MDRAVVGGPRSSRGQHKLRGAQPCLARAPESFQLLPYREGKAASKFTAIGSPACTVPTGFDSNSFKVLKILKKTLTTCKALAGWEPPAGVFGETLKAMCARKTNTPTVPAPEPGPLGHGAQVVAVQ